MLLEEYDRLIEVDMQPRMGYEKVKAVHCLAEQWAHQSWGTRDDDQRITCVQE